MCKMKTRSARQDAGSYEELRENAGGGVTTPAQSGGKDEP